MLIKQFSFDLPNANEFQDAHDALLTVEVIPGEMDKVAAILEAIDLGHDINRIAGEAMDALDALNDRLRSLRRQLEIRAAADAIAKARVKTEAA
jgi:hypothetical protein